MHPKECVVNSIAEEEINVSEADGEHSAKLEDNVRNRTVRQSQILLARDIRKLIP
jgi:hypothetical protein